MEKVEGVIIRTQDYGETHVIVTLFSDKLGKIGVLARGAKKSKSRMSAVSQLFIHGQYLVRTGRGLGTLIQGEVINSHRKIRENIIQTAYASYIAELTDKLLDEKRPNYYIYQQFMATLKGLTEEKDPLVLTMIYEMKLYKSAGFAPRLEGCQNCAKTTDLTSFSIREGGILCKRCLSVDPHHITIDQTQLKLLRLFSEVDIERIMNVSVKDANKNMIKNILEQFYDTYGGLTLKSRKFLKQIDLLK